MLNDNQNCPDLNNNTTEFSLRHLLIRSISKNLDSFSIFLGSLSVKFSVTGIIETWLDDSSHTSYILGYNVIHRHRVDRSCGILRTRRSHSAQITSPRVVNKSCLIHRFRSPLLQEQIQIHRYFSNSLIIH